MSGAFILTNPDLVTFKILYKRRAGLIIWKESFYGSNGLFISVKLLYLVLNLDKYYVEWLSNRFKILAR